MKKLDYLLLNVNTIKILGDKIIDIESITKFIKSLTLSDKHKKTLLKLSPGSYVGMASNIVDQL